MNKDRCLAIFNKTLEEFILDLQRCFPTEAFIGKYYGMYKMVAASSSYQNMKITMKYLEPYEEHIIAGDVDYFLKSDVSGSLSDEGLRLKYLWNHKETDEGTKDAIVKYVQKLYKCGKKYRECSD